VWWDCDYTIPSELRKLQHWSQTFNIWV